MRAFSLLLAAVTALLALTACSSEDTATPTPSPSLTTAADPTPPAAPVVGTCYSLTLDQATQPTNDSAPVSCIEDHTAQTIYVGQLNLLADGHMLAVDSEAVQAQVKQQCPTAFEEYVGGNADRRNLSRLRVVWFSPTLEQADAGAQWFRCDVVAFGQGDEIATLNKQVPHKALKKAKGLTTYGLCGNSAPGSADFVRVLCGLPHTWKAVSTIDLDSSKANTAAYPGAGAVSTHGDEACKEDARSAQNFALTFQYGWEWPTQEQWENGQHYGLCWAPETPAPN